MRGDLFRKVRGDLFETLRAARNGRFPSLVRRSEAVGKLAVDRRVPDQLASDLCHMHCNCLMRSTQRMQELVIYDLMSRAYQGLLHGGGSDAG